ncbi:unnamed protein product, partial [Nesidiocoris tenuis]
MRAGRLPGDRQTGGRKSETSQIQGESPKLEFIPIGMKYKIKKSDAVLTSSRPPINHSHPDYPFDLDYQLGHQSNQHESSNQNVVKAN